MSSQNNNSAQVQAFKDYQAIPDERDEVMSDFLVWLGDNAEEGWPLFEIHTIIAHYLMQDEKSQALIKAGEQELLNKWSKNAKNL